ncbi:hypothetical protein GGI20_000592 [Coemansia sp. BCRC 34301]|nr:hypothetical protein GGI20_000592 [Coemansia sp. BCRC 34301]
MSGHHFGSLISRLFELAGRVSYYSTARCLSMDLQPDDIRNLVHLDYQIKGGNTAQIMQVVRQSSSTLQHLALGAKKDMYVSRLIYGADGSYLRYPCLAVLALNLPTSLPRLCQPVTDGVVLFPSIRRLSILDGYPFGDDTLFRGNAASLETLHIMPSRDMCDVLCMFNVFTPASHPNLQCVKIEQLHNDSPSHFESSREYLQFVLGIAPKTAVRDIAGVADKADDNNLKEIVICVLGVALMCPNFSHVALSNCVHDGFMSVLEETIESDKFRQYNARLRRLLFQKV